MVPRATYGPTGGNALKFYSKIRLKLKVKDQIVSGDKNVGQVVRAFTEKNKAANPQRVCDYYIKYGSGISGMDEILNFGVDSGLILKEKGSWFSMNGTTLGHGRGNAVDFLNKNKEIVDRIKNEVFKNTN